ncbi:MAG: radical SAM protein [Desulfovibrio sp.]|nr:radical SAM protein [Desulfovibrio sp.]
MALPNCQIIEHPDLLMVCRHGLEWGPPRSDELIPLPPESELFLLPGRTAVGLNPESGEVEELEGTLAVAAFLAPAHTLSAHPAYQTQATAPLLPLFAYAAVGFWQDQFYVCAKKVDTEPRQVFANIPKARLEREARRLARAYPKNRLVQHILNNCLASYDCPAARNFALGRYEAPLPSAQTCNARCLGCISARDEDSPLSSTPQCRLSFTPKPEELAEVMEIHASRERLRPIFSFGQGCEGDPLQNAELLAQSISLFRKKGGLGTINCNTNGSRPEVLADLANAGLTSIRVSLNSAKEDLYQAYYRPKGYSFAKVQESLKLARRLELFSSLNLLYFPGLTDTEEELSALTELVSSCGVSFIQLRNLNIDPEWYLKQLKEATNYEPSTCGMGLKSFLKRLGKACPWLKFGYFNPYVGTKAILTSPL